MNEARESSGSTALTKMNIDDARRKRIQRYKMWIVRLFLLATILPSIACIVMLVQVGRLEKQVMAVAGMQPDAQTTILSSKEALMSNPNVDVDSLTGDTQEAPADTTELQDPDDETGDSSDGDGTGTQAEKRVYLTFDDGPSVYTGQILDILAANDVKATFFVIAREDESYWPYYSRIVEEGHTLGMHSYTHDYNQVYASLDAFEEDVDSLSQFLYDRTGEEVKIYRFPGGSSNTVAKVPMQECIAYLNERGIRYYDWNALNGDAVSAELTPDKLVENIMTSVRQNNTSIVLMHDMQSRHTTVESLQQLIDTLKEEGYELLPIDENTPLIQHVPYDTGFGEAAD